MKKINALMVGFLFLITVAGALFAESAGSIQIKGSDTMVNLNQGLAEVYMSKNPKAFIAVTGGGSGTGIASLLGGTCDIAASSRKMKDKEIKQAEAAGIEPKECTIALDGLAVVVNPANPVSNLTIDQLADIFTGKITNWKDVGGVNSEIVILSREVNSGTHVYFKEHVLRKGNEKGPEEFSPGALLMSSSQAIADEVSGNANAVGYYGIGYVSKKQKSIAVAKDKNSPYVLPTIDNVLNGTYPITRPLFFYTSSKPKESAKSFINFALSDEGQKIVMDTDFVPLKKLK